MRNNFIKNPVLPQRLNSEIIEDPKFVQKFFDSKNKYNSFILINGHGKYNPKESTDPLEPHSASNYNSTNDYIKIFTPNKKFKI